jgi:hypothetical protein
MNKGKKKEKKVMRTIIREKSGLIYLEVLKKIIARPNSP